LTDPRSEPQSVPAVLSALRPRRQSPLRIAGQIIGFIVCLSILVFVVYRAFTRPESAAQLERLAAASWWQVAALLACSFATVTLGGLGFAAVLRPVQRLRRTDAVAVNGVVSVISYLPFKIGLAFRIYWHHRHDRVPLLVIAAWFAATAALILTALAPPLLASLWRGTIDALWFVTSAVGMLLAGALIVIIARALAGERGLQRIRRAAGVLRIAFLDRVLTSARFRHLHGGTAMLGSPATVAQMLLLRTLDVASQAVRLYIAAQVCGVALEPSQAVLAGSTYFFLQAATPTGVAGVREGGTIGVMAALGVPDLTVVVLTASLAEVVANVVMAAAGGAWLRWGYRTATVPPTSVAASPAPYSAHNS